MKNMKKIISLALAFVICTFCLISCGKTNSGADTRLRFSAAPRFC